MLGQTRNEKVAVFLSTWFYSGLIPPILVNGMAGTYGSFFSLPLCWIALWLATYYFFPYAFFILVIYFGGIFYVSTAERVLGPRKDWRGKKKDRDQNQIVIDEVFGMLITCFPLLFLPVATASWTMIWLLLLAFVYFRIFDIVKVWPTKYFDNMKNPVGVMLDDGMAGIYASIVLLITYFLFF